MYMTFGVVAHTPYRDPGCWGNTVAEWATTQGPGLPAIAWVPVENRGSDWPSHDSHPRLSCNHLPNMDSGKCRAGIT